MRALRPSPALFVGAALLASCATPTVDLDRKLTNATTVTFGGVWPIDPGRDPLGVYPTVESALRDPESEPPIRPVIELQLSYTFADFEQRLANGESLTLEDTTFSGPATLDADVQLGTGWLAVGRGVALSDALHARGVVGLELTHFDFRLRDSIGPMVGARLGARPLDVLEFSLEGNASLGYAEDATVETREWRALASLALGPVTTLFAGWRELRYIERRSDASADVLLDLSGPVFGLRSGF